MRLKTIIVDDEPLAVSILEKYAAEIKEIELLATFNNAVEAASFVQNNHLDLIFLDINMPVLDGLSFLKSLDLKPMVIMTTAHENHALESFELQAIDYLGILLFDNLCSGNYLIIIANKNNISSLGLI